MFRSSSEEMPYQGLIEEEHFKKINCAEELNINNGKKLIS